MHFSKGLALVMWAGLLYGQTTGDGATASVQPAADPEVVHAQAEVEKLRPLVAAGVAPRAQLEKAEDSLADLQDSAYLRKMLLVKDLSEEQSDEMVAAAGRRFDRRKKAFEDAKKLVEENVAPQLSLGTYLVDLDLARKEFDLAESRARLTREIADMAAAEEALANQPSESTAEAPAPIDRFDGNGIFTPAIFSRIEAAFEARFGKPLPVSAMGETAVHRALGFDHRGRVDVAIHPDTPEGVWLRQYLTTNDIPFFAFRQAVPGKATGAHIHLGPMSTRLKLGG
jgi:hypothetical protein